MRSVLRPAFTLIEVIVSTVIIAIVVMAVLELSSRSTESAMYLAHRNKAAFQDSLFMDPSIVRYHKDNKNAYDLLYAQIKITEDDTKNILKEIKRDIFIPEPLRIPFLEEMGAESTFNKVVIKDAYSSTYLRFAFSLSGNPAAFLEDLNETLYPNGSR